MMWGGGGRVAPIPALDPQISVMPPSPQGGGGLELPQFQLWICNNGTTEQVDLFDLG